ncbi:polysaccharide deacetylase family protein [Brevibacillus ginsengisoli]|uniref:polysaccharide deacetylase family protein n=1 Tax=Brevibacillus ginsengisoli TaxID=363854 RepID=UPI003CF4D515
MRRRCILYSLTFPMFLTLSFLYPSLTVKPDSIQPPARLLDAFKSTRSTDHGGYYVQEGTYRIVGPHGNHENIVLLTIDDGPSGKSTQKLLNVLDKHHAKAIWFVNGRQVADKRKDGTFRIKPEKARLLREIAKRGHIIGNHTWEHPNLRKVSPTRQQEEIRSTSMVIQDITGSFPSYFRPPYGAKTDDSKRIATELGMRTINWSVGSLDWKRSVYKHPGGICEQVMSTIHNGANILFHDRTWTANQMDEVLTALEKKHYRFVLPSY